MISNPELPSLEPSVPTWPSLLSHWQLLALVPGIVSRLESGARVLELEVGGPSILASLSQTYPASRFIGLTSQVRALRFEGSPQAGARNLSFQVVEQLNLGRYRQVDLVLALGGLQERSLLRAVAGSLASGGYLVLREAGARPLTDSRQRGTRYHSMIDSGFHNPPSRRHMLIIRTLTDVFAEVQAVRLPEDPGYYYYVARTA